jgi:MoaA/NifB/PqqE/SkfB family radical SAM enzyme
MTFETFKKVTDQIVPYRDEVRSIALFIDGEPTLNKQLINFLKYVDELRLNKLFLSSNMEFFTRELTDKIFAADIGHTLQYVNCSLDGFNE